MTTPKNVEGSPPDEGSAYKGGGSHIKYSISDMNDLLISTALRIQDADRAREELVAVVKEAFLAKFGAQLAKLDAQIEKAEAKLQKLGTNLKQAELDYSRTLPKLPSSRANQGRDAEDYIEEPVVDWQFRHKVEAVLVSIALFVSTLASLLTAEANLVGSGVQIFLDNPPLAWTMAALAPLSGFAIKTIYESLPGGWPSQTFKFALITAMVVSIVLWLLLYAQSYHGLSPDISFGGVFDAPSAWDQIRDTAFVAISLTTEVLIGAVLAVRLTVIAGCYSPDYSKDNPAFFRLEKKVEGLTKLQEELDEAHAEMIGQRAEYGHCLTLQIQTLTLAHDGRRGASSTPIL